MPGLQPHNILFLVVLSEYIISTGEQELYIAYLL